MNANRLSEGILDLLEEKIPQLTRGTIKKNISLMRRDHSAITMNGAAQLVAQQYGSSIMRKLNEEDRKSIAHIHVDAQPVKSRVKRPKAKPKRVELIEYESTNHFVTEHVKEVNRAYTNHCYTAASIISRKIIENLIREILIDRFPSRIKKNRELYYDINQRRFKDFSELLGALYNNRHRFPAEKVEMIESLYKKVKKFKSDANTATHSWYGLVEIKQEIDDLKIQSMIELINGIRS